MGEVTESFSKHQNFHPKNLEHVTCQDKESEEASSFPTELKGKNMTSYESKDNEEASELLEKGFLQHG